MNKITLFWGITLWDVLFAAAGIVTLWLIGYQWQNFHEVNLLLTASPYITFFVVDAFSALFADVVAFDWRAWAANGFKRN